MNTAISTEKAPAAIGPYSQAIQAEGKTIYVSGQLPVDPATGAFAGEDIADLGIAFLLDRNQRIRNRILLPDFIGSRKFSDIIETHDFSPSQTVLMKHHSLSGCTFMQNGSVFHYSIGKTQAQANFIISYQFPCSFFMGRFHARMKICLRKATEGAPLYEQK